MVATGHPLTGRVGTGVSRVTWCTASGQAQGIGAWLAVHWVGVTLRACSSTRACSTGGCTSSGVVTSRTGDAAMKGVYFHSCMYSELRNLSNVISYMYTLHRNSCNLDSSCLHVRGTTSRMLYNIARINIIPSAGIKVWALIARRTPGAGRLASDRVIPRSARDHHCIFCIGALTAGRQRVKLFTDVPTVTEGVDLQSRRAGCALHLSSSGERSRLTPHLQGLIGEWTRKSCWTMYTHQAPPTAVRPSSTGDHHGAIGPRTGHTSLTWSALWLVAKRIRPWLTR